MSGPHGVALDIPARPEFVGLARMSVAALAGLGGGFSYERVEDLRIVVSEACTSAIEATPPGSDARLRLRLLDAPDLLEIAIEHPEPVFEAALNSPPDGAGQLRISLLRALVDEVRTSAGGACLHLVAHRSHQPEDQPEDPDEGE
ncbi:MAG: ATP-binding protein [Acidimicrobiia bacterium]